MKKVVFANIVNELMIGSIEHSYAQKMNVFTPRKIWLAEEDDVLVTPNPIPDYFKEYACKILSIDPDSVTTITPSGDDMTLLSERIKADAAAWTQFSHALSDGTHRKLLPFAVDRPLMHFTDQVGIDLYRYSAKPDSKTIDHIYQLNTKLGFVRFVENLGLPVLDYIEVEGIENLVRAVEDFSEKHSKVIIKFNRSSNGFGHFVYDRSAAPLPILSRKLVDFYSQFSQPKHFIVEKFLENITTPSVEILVSDDDVKVLYVCDQRCVNNAYCGMETPPTSISSHTIKQMHEIGRKFGEAVQSLGFRGICDVDTCVKLDTGEIYLSETNFRRTAGTFIDALVRRLTGTDYYPDKYLWIQDARTSKLSMDFKQGLDLLEENKLHFDMNCQSGVVLYVDTLEYDNKWRYIIIGKEREEVREIEERLQQVFALNET